MKTQVLILGGGAIGSAIAAHLGAEPGFEIFVLERDPSYAQASSALSAASIRQQFSTPLNIALSQYGLQVLRAAGAEAGLVERGYLYLASPAGAHHLRELHALTGNGRYLFPGARSAERPISHATINAALRRLGYETRTEITGHGFRAMARTILHEELEQKPEVIEHQLAHAVPDTLGRAYNRTRFLKERRTMMQLWADYLDRLKKTA